MRKGDVFTTFVCRVSRNSVALTYQNCSGPVVGLLYLTSTDVAAEQRYALTDTTEFLLYRVSSNVGGSSSIAPLILNLGSRWR